MATYTNEMYYQDMNKIMYSPYFRAMASRQHSVGTITQDSLLWSKKRMAEKIYENLGGKGTNYLEVLLYASALATPPFGHGGAEVLKEKYGYDKNSYTLKIAKQLGLDDEAIADLDKTSSQGSIQGGVVQALDVLLDKRVGVTPEMEKEIIEDITATTKKRVSVSRELYDRLTVFTPSALQVAAIAGQKEAMERAIKCLEEQDIPEFQEEPILYILKQKETRMLDLQKKNNLNIQSSPKR